MLPQRTDPEIPGMPDITVEVIEFIPKVNLQKTAVNKSKRAFSVGFFQEAEPAERRSSYDTFLQIVDGTAEIKIKDKQYKLNLGEGIIVPSNVTYHFITKKGFKMISTVLNYDKYK